MSKIALVGGLGYPVTETEAGMPTLQQRFVAIGVTCQIFTHLDSNGCYAFLKGYSGFRAIIGDSLGAGAANRFAQDQGDAIQFVGGFQPSNYDPLCKFDPTTQLYYITVPSNVKVAHCIRDPNWIDTSGLGNATYERLPGDKQPCLVTLHPGAHPDDWGYSQDLIFNQVKGMLNA